MRKLLISLPDPLAQKLDEHVKSLGVTRSAYLRDAILRDLSREARSKLHAQMRLGYRQMAQINLELADAAHDAQWESLEQYERLLASDGVQVSDSFLDAYAKASEGIGGGEDDPAR